ncbi:MAG: hypothetical protein ACREOA_09935 [Candidatus Dormibacteria bacterium]
MPNLQQTVRIVQSRSEETLGSAGGLSWAEYQLLFRLNFASDRPLLMSNLAERLLTNPNGATRIADRRVDKKLIQREVPADNRRVVRPMLTGRGRTTVARADRAFHQSLDKAFSSAVNDDPVPSLRAILRGILEHN